MKKLIWIAIISLGGVIYWGGCNKEPEAKMATGGNEGTLILSVPDYALGILLKTQASPSTDNLKLLRNFDNELYKALLSNSTIGKYAFTRKFNPCCPCSPGGTSCCNCQKNMTFASPSSMGVTVEIESSASGRSESIQKDSKDGIDLFTIPAGAEDDPTLVFHITGIDTPIKFRLLE